MTQKATASGKSSLISLHPGALTLSSRLPPLFEGLVTSCLVQLYLPVPSLPGQKLLQTLSFKPHPPGYAYNSEKCKGLCCPPRQCRKRVLGAPVVRKALVLPTVGSATRPASPHRYPQACTERTPAHRPHTRPCIQETHSFLFLDRSPLERSPPHDFLLLSFSLDSDVTSSVKPSLVTVRCRASLSS